MKPEIRKVLVCSTSHVPGHVAKRLNAGTLGIEGVVIEEDIEYGWLVRYWAPKEDGGRSVWPVQIRLVIERAESLGCSMILFDCDADTLDGIRTYDW